MSRNGDERAATAPAPSAEPSDESSSRRPRTTPRGGVRRPLGRGRHAARAVEGLQELDPPARGAARGPEGFGIVAVLVLAVASVTLLVIAPKILGSATNIIVDGVTSGKGIDFTEAAPDPARRARRLRRRPRCCRYLQAYLLAGVVQRAMYRLRSDVEDKLNRMPLRYVDRQPRGDMLSRVTNDIDNLAQSLQQTLSQLLTSTLTLVGVLIMMITISPLLVAGRARSRSRSRSSRCRCITKRSKTKFVDQWRHTGTLNAQVEEAFTGHSLVKVFGRQHDVEAAVQRQERGAVRGELRARSSSPGRSSRR